MARLNDLALGELLKTGGLTKLTKLFGEGDLQQGREQAGSAQTVVRQKCQRF